MKSDVARDWKWADKHISAIESVLRKCAIHIINIKVAPAPKDLKEATDYIVEVDGGDIAVRVRRVKYVNKYRDLTLRSRRASGATTELEKIKGGYGQWYLYAWSNGSSDFVDWILVDLDQLRGSGLLDRNWHEIPNKDGQTWFIPISAKTLNDYGCITAKKDDDTEQQTNDGSYFEDLYNQELAKEMAKIQAFHQPYQD